MQEAIFEIKARRCRRCGGLLTSAQGLRDGYGTCCLDCCSKTDGTVLYIDGIGERVVEDRGGAITEGKLDVLCEDHAACYAITGWYDVYIVEGGAS